MAQQDLTSKIVIVTGAGGGMGKAMSLGLLECGARIAAVDNHLAKLESLRLAAAPAERLLPIAADITRAEDCEEIIRRTISQWGAVHVLVNNAGIGMQTIREN